MHWHSLRLDRHGFVHADTLTSIKNMAGLLKAQGKLTEAEALAARRETLIMAMLLEDQGKREEAEMLMS